MTYNRQFVVELGRHLLRNDMIARPKPCILGGFDYLGFVRGQQMWSSDNGQRLYTWDSLHGEVEVFNRRGKHLGVKDAVTGTWIKQAVAGRSIDV